MLPGWAWLGFVGVAVVVLAAYAPSMVNGWSSWDDPQNFAKNPHFRGLGGEQLRWMFTRFWMGHYQPLAWVTLGLDYTIWGMDARGYHLTNVLLHAAGAGLTALLAARLFLLSVRPDGQTKGSRGRARATNGREDGWLGSLGAARAATIFGVVVGLAWGLHPLRVEAASWVTQRREVLCGVLTLLALWNTARGGPWWTTQVFGIGAMLAKATAVTLPALCVLVELFRTRAFADVSLGGLAGAMARAVFRNALLLGVAAGLTAVAFVAQAEAEARIPWDWLPLHERFVLYFHGVGFYAVKSVWPWPLAPLYEGPRDWIAGSPTAVPRMSPVAELLPGAMASAAAAALALAAGVWMRRTRPALLCLVVAYLAMIVPVGGFGQSGPQIAADRYAYQPGWALTLVAAGGAWLVVSRLRSPVSAAMWGWIAAIVLGAWTVVSVRMQRIWHDEESIWVHTLRYFPNTARAHSNLGQILARRTPPEDDAAEMHYRAALAKIPQYSDCLFLLGEVRARKGRPDEALELCQRAVHHAPGHPQASRRIPLLLWQMGKSDEAIAGLRQLAQRHPTDIPDRIRLAKALAASGPRNAREAVEVLKEAVASFPKDGELRTELAWLLATHPDPGVRDGAGALELAREARRLNPADLRALMAYVAALADMGDFSGAARELDEVMARTAPEVRGAIGAMKERMEARDPIRVEPTFP